MDNKETFQFFEMGLQHPMSHKRDEYLLAISSSPQDNPYIKDNHYYYIYFSNQPEEDAYNSIDMSIEQLKKIIPIQLTAVSETENIRLMSRLDISPVKDQILNSSAH